MLCSVRFWNDVRGSFSPIIAIAIVPLMAAGALAVDMGRTYQLRDQMQVAVDAGALAAGRTRTNRTDAEIARDALAIIRQNLPPQLRDTITSVEVQQNDASRPDEVRLTIRATPPRLLAATVGLSNPEIVTGASYNKRPGQKIEFAVLLDNSASMGLAATAAGRDKLITLRGCAFACHEPEGGQTTSNLQVAQENGILTRVDVLRSAVTKLLSRMDAFNNGIDKVKVSVSSFDDTLVKHVAYTEDLSAARAYMQNFKLGGNTNFSGAMPTFTDDALTTGNPNARRFMLIVTDGVQGRRDRSVGFKPFDSTQCDTFKRRGATVLVLNTKYIPMPTMQPYIDTVQPIETKLEPALQACSSGPQNYFSAVDQRDIEIAFDGIFQRLTASLRLTR